MEGGRKPSLERKEWVMERRSSESWRLFEEQYAMSAAWYAGGAEKVTVRCCLIFAMMIT